MLQEDDLIQFLCRHLSALDSAERQLHNTMWIPYARLTPVAEAVKIVLAKLPSHYRIDDKEMKSWFTVGEGYLTSLAGSITAIESNKEYYRLISAVMAVFYIHYFNVKDFSNARFAIRTYCNDRATLDSRLEQLIHENTQLKRALTEADRKALYEAIRQLMVQDDDIKLFNQHQFIEERLATLLTIVVSLRLQVVYVCEVLDAYSKLPWVIKHPELARRLSSLQTVYNNYLSWLANAIHVAKATMVVLRLARIIQKHYKQDPEERSPYETLGRKFEKKYFNDRVTDALTTIDYFMWLGIAAFNATHRSKDVVKLHAGRIATTVGGVVTWVGLIVDVCIQLILFIRAMKDLLSQHEQRAQYHRNLKVKIDIIERRMTTAEEYKKIINQLMKDSHSQNQVALLTRTNQRLQRKLESKTVSTAKAAQYQLIMRKNRISLAKHRRRLKESPIYQRYHVERDDPQHTLKKDIFLTTDALRLNTLKARTDLVDQVFDLIVPIISLIASTLLVFAAPINPVAAIAGTALVLIAAGLGLALTIVKAIRTIHANNKEHVQNKDVEEIYQNSPAAFSLA